MHGKKDFLLERLRALCNVQVNYKIKTILCITFINAGKSMKIYLGIQWIHDKRRIIDFYYKEYLSSYLRHWGTNEMFKASWKGKQLNNANIHSLLRLSESKRILHTVIIFRSSSMSFKIQYNPLILLFF